MKCFKVITKKNITNFCQCLSEWNIILQYSLYLQSIPVKHD